MHSMCHPGRPGPHGLAQVGSSGFAAFQRAEVPVISLRGRLISGSTARTLLHRIEGLSSQCPELGRSGR